MANVGIEIENESLSIGRAGVRDRLPHGSPWHVEMDGSLRGGDMGWEIKTTRDGVPIQTLEYALSALYPVMQDASGTWRAAVHVHVDMRNRSWYERALALAFAYCVDESVFQRFGPERMESNFCVALSRKTSDVCATLRNMVALAVRDDSMIVDRRVGYGKYSSVNVDSLASFGTFEFRHMRTPGTSSDLASISRALTEVSAFAHVAHTVATCSDCSDRPRSVLGVARALESLTRARSFLRTRGLLANPIHAMEMQALLVTCLPMDDGNPDRYDPSLDLVDEEGWRIEDDEEPVDELREALEEGE